jgi:hypothetical protein
MVYPRCFGMLIEESRFESVQIITDPVLRDPKTYGSYGPRIPLLHKNINKTMEDLDEDGLVVGDDILC